MFKLEWHRNGGVVKTSRCPLRVLPLLIVDANQYEFESPSSEQALTIASAGQREFKDIAAFLSACPNASSIAIDTLTPVPFASLGRSSVLAHISRFHNREIPRDADTFIINDEWNDFEFVCVFASSYIWYHWDTSA